MNGIRQYVVSRDWLLSHSIMLARFIHVSALNSFLWLSTILMYVYTTLYLSVHQLVDIWLIFTLTV